jgi:hypothetical protein
MVVVHRRNLFEHPLTLPAFEILALFKVVNYGPVRMNLLKTGLSVVIRLVNMRGCQSG